MNCPYQALEAEITQCPWLDDIFPSGTAKKDTQIMGRGDEKGTGTLGDVNCAEESPRNTREGGDVKVK